MVAQVKEKSKQPKSSKSKIKPSLKSKRSNLKDALGFYKDKIVSQPSAWEEDLCATVNQ